MMRSKLIKTNGKCYIQLPDSFSNLEEIELFQLKDSFWLISAPLSKFAAEPRTEARKLSDDEKAVLHKLIGIRFADRTPSNIEKIFSPAEKETVRILIKKGFIHIFYGKKYEKTGVYNISDSIYPLISHEEAAKSAANPEPDVPKSAPAIRPSAPPTYSQLSNFGWIIISNPRDAEQFTFDIKRAGLSANVKGVRGFDGKFYVATTKFFYTAQQKILEVMKKKSGMLVEEIATAASMDPEPVGVVLRLLAESGEVIEKKRGLFCPA